MFDAIALLKRLTDAEVVFVVIGGLAASLHGATMVTEDLDILYERSRPNLDRLAGALNDLGARLRGAEDLPLRMDAQLLYAGDRFTLTTTYGALDVLATADGAAPYADIKARALQMKIDSFVVWLASLDDLITMKRAVNRPKDRAKLEELLDLRELAESELSE